MGNEKRLIDVRDYITPDAVAKRVGRTRRTVYTHLRDGTLKATKVGTQWLISPEDLRAYAKSR